MNDTKKRGMVLAKAIEVINGERQDHYGNPEDSFLVIAEFWETYLRSRKPGKLQQHDVCMMMTLFKIARELNQKRPDNLVDAAGYIGIAGDLNFHAISTEESHGKRLTDVAAEDSTAPALVKNSRF